MKRIKIILLCCVVFIISCKKIEPILPSVSLNNKEFFSVSENTVKNGDIMNFTLTAVGVYHTRGKRIAIAFECQGIGIGLAIGFHSIESGNIQTRWLNAKAIINIHPTTPHPFVGIWSAISSQGKIIEKAKAWVHRNNPIYPLNAILACK